MSNRPSNHPHARRSAQGNAAGDANSGVAGGSKKLVVLSAIFAVALIGVAGGAFFMGKQHGAAENNVAAAGDSGEHQKKYVAYYTLTPPLGLDIKGGDEGSHAFQLNVAFALNDENGTDIIKSREPSIRDKFVEIAGSRTYLELLTPEGKEKLRAEFLAGIQKILEDSKTPKCVVAVLFPDYAVE